MDKKKGNLNNTLQTIIYGTKSEKISRKEMAVQTTDTNLYEQTYCEVKLMRI